MTTDDSQSSSGHTDYDFAEAVDLAEEAIAYVTEYFREKWDMTGRLDRLKKLVDPVVAKEFWHD